ncbi:MAG: threonine synthase [Bacillota bacterium]
MDYISSRDTIVSVKASQAIIQGIAPDGGLFVPEEFPQMDLEAVLETAKKGYTALAAYIAAPYLDEFSEEEVQDIAANAYDAGFEHADKAPVMRLQDGQYVLELWHGPTLAFKDMALQMLPHLMSASRRKIGEQARILILVATSGDTGKAALEGFAGVEGISIAVFYPHNGVSRAQELQMVTHVGDNVFVGAVRGNFDDTQTAIKRVFGNAGYAEELAGRGFRLSSANSINWGRLLPQIVYYFWAYACLVRDRAVSTGGPVNFVVPTGNFGNILAGYYAKRMGLPVNKLICASNANNVLTDFFTSGGYDATRPFYKTISPSMDILISSNLERLLFEIAHRDGARVRDWMATLRSKGAYQVAQEYMEEASALFAAGCCDDAQTKETIRNVFESRGYLMDPHTAVAKRVLDDYMDSAKDFAPSVLVSTASPFKFSADVLSALGDVQADADEFELAARLGGISGMKVPDAILKLQDMPIRFKEVLDAGAIEARMLAWAQMQSKG